MQDYHIHTTFSFDGKSTVAEYMAEAENKGLDALCFTEHYNPEGPYGVDLGRLPDLQKVHDAVDAARKRGGPVKPLWGVEIGLYNEHSASLAQELLKDWEMDFILMGSHWNRVGRDYWISSEWNGDSKSQAQRENMETLLSFIRTMDHYDVIAHINYFSRGCPYEDKEIRYSDAPDEIDTVLDEIISRGKGIEVNTSTYLPFGFTMPGESILSRYREKGGEIVTMGSDAHHTGNLGAGLGAARELLKQVGFRYYTVFEGRKPAFIKL